MSNGLASLTHEDFMDISLSLKDEENSRMRRVCIYALSSCAQLSKYEL